MSLPRKRKHLLHYQKHSELPKISAIHMNNCFTAKPWGKWPGHEVAELLCLTKTTSGLHAKYTVSYRVWHLFQQLSHQFCEGAFRAAKQAKGDYIVHNHHQEKRVPSGYLSQIYKPTCFRTVLLFLTCRDEPRNSEIMHYKLQKDMVLP